MRLINVDKYCEFLNTYPLEKVQDNFMTFYRDALQHTSECEVSAIPIEWIEQNIKELEAELQSLYSRFRSQGDSKEKGEALLRCVELRTPLTAYETVLSEWRKENAA